MNKTSIDWNHEIEEYLASGKTYKAFCENKAYSVSAFRNRMYRYRKNHKAGEILPVTVAVSKAAHPVKVNGWEIIVDQDTDVNALRLILQAMKEQ